MPKGSIKKACRVCYDTGYNKKNFIFSNNLERHYKNANKRNKDGSRIPPHDLNIDVKGYNIDKNGAVITTIKKKNK